MYFSFLSLPLGCMPLEEKLAWASTNGFQAAELACWPRLKEEDRRFSDLDILKMTEDDIQDTKEIMVRTGMKISLLASYDNNLNRNLEQRAFTNDFLRKSIDVAAKIGAPAVGTFVGRNFDKSISENFEDFRSVFIPLVEYAEQKKVQILIENCPQRGGENPEMIGNIGCSPELWEKMFRIISSPYFGLNFDPAHLHWQMIDCVEAAREFASQIHHMHAKDVVIFPEKLAKYGISNKLLGNSFGGYWQYCLVGKGDIPWETLMNALTKKGFHGAVSMEHIAVKPDGNETQIQDDFVNMKEYLEHFVH